MRPTGVDSRRCSAALTALVVAGCAAPAPSAGPAPSALSAPPPASAPAGPPAPGPSSAPPIGFTDVEKRPGWVVGTVTRGGTGPCYGFLTEGGETLALHSTQGLTLQQDATVRVQVVPATHRIACGDGQPMTLRAVEPLG